MATPPANYGELTPEEVGRRVRAARILRRWDDREQLARKLAESCDVASSRLALIERGHATLQAPYRNALAEFLELPREWFTAPLEELWGHDPGQLDRIEAKLDALLEIPPGQVVQRLAAVVREHLPPNGGPE